MSLNILRFFFWFFMLFLSLSQSFAYTLTTIDQNILDSVMPKFYTLIDRGNKDTAGVIIEKIDDIEASGQSERVIRMLGYISDNIELKYTVGKYIVAYTSTPVLHTPDFKAQFGGSDGMTLNFDSYGEIDALEYVALENTVFELKRELDNDIYEVITDDYPVENMLYIHKNFVSDIKRVEPEARVSDLPSKEEILKRLKSIEGKDYVWGGNDPNGIPKILELYAPNSEISSVKKMQWQLEWVDCSGLIYWATDGYTPRNTSWIVDYWETLDIVGKSLEEITPMLEPLDIIVWRGHMLVVYDEDYTIESTVSPNGGLAPGVQIRKIEDSLWEVLQERFPVNHYYLSAHSSPFVIVRWID